MSISIGEYILKGRAIYPSNGTPFVWELSPSMNSPDKVLQYESYFIGNSDWKICEDPYMDIEFSYWYRDKAMNKIRLSSYDVTNSFHSILDGETTKNYSAIIVSEF